MILIATIPRYCERASIFVIRKALPSLWKALSAVDNSSAFQIAPVLGAYHADHACPMVNLSRGDFALRASYRLHLEIVFERCLRRCDPDCSCSIHQCDLDWRARGRFEMRRGEDFAGAPILDSRKLYVVLLCPASVAKDNPRLPACGIAQRDGFGPIAASRSHGHERLAGGGSQRITRVIRLYGDLEPPGTRSEVG